MATIESTRLEGSADHFVCAQSGFVGKQATMRSQASDELLPTEVRLQSCYPRMYSRLLSCLHYYTWGYSLAESCFIYSKPLHAIGMQQLIQIQIYKYKNS